MSSTTGRHYRHLAGYYTPPDLAQAAVSWLDIAPGETCLEPHLGGGAFAEAFRLQAEALGVPITVVGMDLNPDAPGRSLVDEFVEGDFLKTLPPAIPGIVGGNPPNSRTHDLGLKGDGTPRTKPIHVGHEHVIRAYDLLPPGGHLLLILRQAFTATRLPLWEERPPKLVLTCKPRPSFGWWDEETQTIQFGPEPLFGPDGEPVIDKRTGRQKRSAGTDSAEMALHWWVKGWRGHPGWGWLRWKEPHDRRWPPGHYGNRMMGVIG